MSRGRAGYCNNTVTILSQYCIPAPSVSKWRWLRYEGGRMLRILGYSWHSGALFSTVVKSRSLLCSPLGVRPWVPALATPAATAAAGPKGRCDDGGVVSDETNDHYVVPALAGIYKGEHSLVARVHFNLSSNSLCLSRDQIDSLIVCYYAYRAPKPYDFSMNTRTRPATPR